MLRHIIRETSSQVAP